MSATSDTNLYRLVTRNLSDRERRPESPDAGRPVGVPSAAVAAAASIEVLLAPLGVSVIGVTEAPVREFSQEDVGGPATVSLINLNMPIDLPAIDHVLRGTDHPVLELRPVVAAPAAAG